MMKRILVATDFSTRSDRALRRATILATQFGARLSLAHVVDDDQPASLVKTQIDASWPVLEASVRTLKNYDGIVADAHVVTGDPSAGILAAADEADADLIVLGPHRRQLRDIFVGTTAERTVARSTRPLLMAAGVPSAAYPRALVALDLEEGSRQVANRVHDLGILEPANIVAMYAFDAVARGMLQRAMTDGDAVDDYVRGEGARALAEFQTFLGTTALRKTRHRALPLNATETRTILECARDEEASLIVVGTSQRTGIERFLLGSVAERVLGASDRDVLVVPALPVLADA